MPGDTDSAHRQGIGSPSAQAWARHGQAERFARGTEAGGTTWIPGTGQFVPVGSGDDDRIPNRFIVGGAPNPATGTRFPTTTVLGTQFSASDARAHMNRAEAETENIPSATFGSWINPNTGNIELDVGTVHSKKRDARQEAEGRRELAFFQTRGMRDRLTSWGKKAREETRAARAANRSGQV